MRRPGCRCGSVSRSSRFPEFPRRPSLRCALACHSPLKSAWSVGGDRIWPAGHSTLGAGPRCCGLAPFAVCAISLGGMNIVSEDIAWRSLQAWAALILCFLGAVHWGATIRPARGGRNRRVPGAECAALPVGLGAAQSGPATRGRVGCPLVQFRGTVRGGSNRRRRGVAAALVSGSSSAPDAGCLRHSWVGSSL